MKLHKKGMLASGFSAILCVLFILLFFLGEWTAAGMTRDLDALNAGERWSAAGEPYATITLHTASESALSLNQVESYAMAIESGLRSASIESSESGRVWTYSYFAEDLVTVSGPKAQAPLRTIAAGGSFFTFHPLEFVYGAPFTYDRALPDGLVLDDLETLREYFIPLFYGKHNEELHLISLDAAMRPLADTLISEGSLTATPLNIKRIVETAINNHAVSVILAHNHPSGAPRPSSKDVSATESVRAALELVEIAVLDHVIVAEENICSFKHSAIPPFDKIEEN